MLCEDEREYSIEEGYRHTFSLVIMRAYLKISDLMCIVIVIARVVQNLYKIDVTSNL